MSLFMRAGWLRLIAAFFVTSLAFSGVQAATIKKAGDGPAIWKIDSARSGSRVYLFGSVHMLKKGVVWFNPKIEGALGQATDLVLETNIDPAGMQEITKFIMREGVYPEGDGLKNHIDPKLFDETIALGNEVGLKPEVLGRLKPWYAGMMLSLTYVQSHGYEAQSGVEATLQAVAAKKGLTVSGLETVAEQMQSIAGNAPEVQEAMLRSSVDELKDITKTLNELTEAWITGDTVRLDKTLVQPMRKIPAFYEAMLIKRNQNWIPKINEMLNQPGTHFVVVGVAHLVGKDGVIRMLRDKGVKAERF